MKSTITMPALAFAVAAMAASGAAFAQDTAEEAQAMLEQAETLRAEADAMTAKAEAFLAKAEAAATEAAPDPEPEATETAEAEVEEEEGALGDIITVAYEEGGKHFTADDIPTYKVTEDGTVDWYTFSGFRRYHAECHVCHGPDGEGSTYAPALKDSALTMDYYDFYSVVVNGRHNSNSGGDSVMPSFGTNPNVMCYLDDIYIYLKARGAGDLPRGRPGKKERPTEMFREMENACMG